MPRRESPSPPKRGPRPGDVEVREVLLRAAAELITERGFGDISRREVAERAGVTPAMVTYYFDGTDGLWDALRSSGLQDLRASMADPDRAPGTPRSVADVLAQMIETAHARPWMPILMLRSLLGGPKQRNGFTAAQAPTNLALLRAALTSKGLAGPGVRRDVPIDALLIIIIAATIFPVLARPALELATGRPFDEAARARLASTLATLVTAQGSEP